MKSGSRLQHRLVNEKTLELNITHEGMVSAKIGVVGFTQQQESVTGADVLYPCTKPFVIQFKAAKGGVDNSSATFYVNNNKRLNQHRALDAIASSGVCEAYYAFPLIVSDLFLTTNFGSLLGFTVIVEAQKLTGALNWISETHNVEVQANGQFTVSSEEKVAGRGFFAKEFFQNKSKERKNNQGNGRRIAEYLPSLIESMEHAVKEAGIVGQSEHTITVVGTDIDGEHLGYLQLPVRIRGLKKEPEEKVMFR